MNDTDGAPTLRLDHLLAAVDQSEEGRAVLRVAARLAGLAGGRITALTVERASGDSRLSEQARTRLEATVREELAGAPGAASVDVAVGFGLPGIEIGRIAEDVEAGLVVVGRKRRSHTQRLLLGDTASEVVRRARVPCLAVRAGTTCTLERVLVALDGSRRGLSVLLAAMDLARAVDGTLRAVTVEQEISGEAGDHAPPTGKSRFLGAELERIRPAAALAVHRGSVVEQVLAEQASWGADVLAVGHHRGGPAGVIEAGSVARRLWHEAPCAVLTVPL
jgi:nucleotide-binding universal stress UspA family protein